MTITDILLDRAANLLGLSSREDMQREVDSRYAESGWWDCVDETLQPHWRELSTDAKLIVCIEAYLDYKGPGPDEGPWAGPPSW